MSYKTDKSIKDITTNGLFKNRIINGDFSVRQRGANTLSNQQDFILDRFQTQTHGSIIVAKDLLVLPNSVSLVDNVDPFGDGSGVALYKFDGNANDAGGKYNGTWTGTEQYDTGVFGQAAKFASQGYVTTTLDNPFKSDFTFSCWHFGLPIPDNGADLTFAAHDADHKYGLVFRDYANNRELRWTIGNGSNWLEYFGPPKSGILSNGNWHFITLTKTGRHYTFYIDGNIVYEYDASHDDYQGSGYIRFGIWGNGNYYNTNNLTDQVRIFNRALTQEEVTKLYLEENQIIKKPYHITLKTGNKPSNYTTGTTKHLIYRFEGQHLYDLVEKGSKVTVSFDFSAKKQGKYAVALINKTTSNYETLLETFDYTEPGRYSVTFDLSQIQNEVKNDENLGFELVICGYTEDTNLVGNIGHNIGEKICTSDCIAIDNEDVISISNVQLEEGAVATEFEYIPYDIQLQRCLRYYEKGFFRKLSSHYSSGISGKGHSDIMKFTAIKRTTPTITRTNISTAYATDGGIIYVDKSQFIAFVFVIVNGSGHLLFNWEADAEL